MILTAQAIFKNGAALFNDEIVKILSVMHFSPKYRDSVVEAVPSRYEFPTAMSPGPPRFYAVTRARMWIWPYSEYNVLAVTYESDRPAIQIPLISEPPEDFIRLYQEEIRRAREALKCAS